MMDKLKKAFGYSDPLASGQHNPLSASAVDTQAYLDALKLHQQGLMKQQSMMNQAARQSSLLGAQNMAGGMGHVGLGMASNVYQPQTDAFLLGVIANTKVKTRSHIAAEVEKMAEEIGAPTLLHAVVLAIRTMEIPE